MIVRGAYGRIGGSLSLRAEVLDAATGRLLRAPEPVVVDPARPRPSIRALRQRVMAAVATLRDPRLRDWIEHASRPSTFEAYRAFTAGLELALRGSTQRDAIPLLYRAARDDSSFTLPLLWAALTHRNLIAAGQGSAGDRRRFDSLTARLHARRDRLPPLERHFLDYLRARDAGDNEESLRAIKKVVALAPGTEYEKFAGQLALKVNRPREAVRFFERLDPARGWLRDYEGYWRSWADAHHLLGEHERELAVGREGRRRHPHQWGPRYAEVWALAALGRAKELERAIRDAESLAPEGWRSSLGTLLLDAGRELREHGHPGGHRFLERSVRWFEAAEGEGSEWKHVLHDWLRVHRLLALLELGRAREARIIGERLQAEAEDGYVRLWPLGLALAAAGDTAGAREILGRLAPTDGHAHKRALIAGMLGDRELSLRSFEEALRRGYPNLAQSAHIFASFIPFRDDPEFRRVLDPRG